MLMKNKFQSKAVPRGTRTIWRYLSALILLFSLSIGQMWGQDVTLADINYTQWDGTAMPANSSLSNSNTYYASNGTSRVATLVGKGCKLDDSSNQPTATGVSGSYEHYLRFGSSGNYLNITASNDLVKNAGETSYGKVRFLVSSQKNKTTDELAEVKIGETSLGKIYAFTSTSTCDWVEFDIPATVSKNATITLTRTTNTLFVWGIQIKTFTSSSSPVSVTGITLAPSSATIKVGKTVTLVPTITPSDATDKAVTWAVTSGSSYASVTSGGVVEGLAAGTAVVTATAHDGSGVTQTATITVEDCPTSGTLFSMTVTDPDGTVYTNVTNAAPQLIGATYVGGKAYATSTSSSKRSPKITGDEFDFNVSSSSSVAVKVELDCPLAEGDIISFTSTHTKEFKIQKVAGTNLHQTSSLSLAIPSGSSLIDEDVFYVLCANSACSFSEINIIRPIYRTITLEYADDVTPDGSLKVIDGEKAAKPADPTWAHHRFDGWYNGASPYDWTATVSGDLTLTAHWTQLYTISFANGGGSGDAPAAIPDKAATETFEVPANTFTAPTGQVFDKWNDGTNDYKPGDTYTVGTANVTLTAVWRTPATMYAITKATPSNGTVNADLAEAEAGATVTITASPAADYLFDAWDVYKTDDSETKVTVTETAGVYTFTMPAYAVTVNATFVADTRSKILYLTATSEADTKANDKLYAALKDAYNVTIAAPNTQTLTNYDLIVLHESIGGTNTSDAVVGCKTTSVPVLNTKSYFYNNANTSDRWGWGTPNAGTSVKGCTPNAAYCNIADHPIFAGVIDAGFVEITDEAANKCMQPIGAFTTGLEGYTLATTPNASSGNGCAIHEIPAGNSLRGATSGKYLMISVSNAKLNALNANGQKLFQNAAAYLIGSTAWTPIVVPTAAEVTASPSAAYSVGDDIALTASATGISATTTYTWYKGDTWAEAEAAGAIQAAKTAAEDGNVYSKTSCALGDAGKYWCVISNGTDCEASASLDVTVSDASYNISFVSAHGTVPTATTGVGYLLPELTESGYQHLGWTASVDVIVDAEPVTAGTLIANGKTAGFSADVVFTAVWKQIFEVTFNLQGHGAAIAKQDIVEGSKAVKPADPSEIGFDFGGWFKEATCENEFDFNTAINAATELFAKWTAFDGCTVLVPATSGSTLNAGDAVDLQTGSTGGSIKALTANLSYDANGLLFGDNSSTKVEVTLTHLMKEGTVITATIYNADASKARGLNLLNSNGTSKATWTKTQAGDHVETYTVVADDGLDGSNVFQLQRNQNAYLKELKVSNCGAAVVYHNLTSAVNIAGKGTVTLGATSVREGHSTTATYSDIDPLYEFVSWSVSGAGASLDDATANPVNVTVGTEDAVVTLNLQVKPVYYTVTYMDGTTEMGTEEVAENGHPTAAGIATAKKGSTFLGWSEIDGGAVVDLADITITAAKTIYAKYEAIACPVSGTVFSMTITDPENTEYNENNEFGLEIGATYTGGKAYSGSKDSNKRKGKIDANGEYSFNANGDVTVKVDLDCALQEGDVLSFTSTPSRELKIQKEAGTDLYTTSGKSFTIPAASSLIGEYQFYLMRDNSQSAFKTFNVYRPAVLTGVTLSDAVVAIDSKVTPVMTLAPAPDAYISSQVWSIEGAGEGTIATINTETGEVTGKAIGSVTVKVVLNGSIENTCTVTVIDSYTQVAVTETSEWNFAGAAAASSKINFPNSTEEFLLANISGVNNTPEFNSRALVVKGKYVSNSQLQAQTIRFNVTTSGKLTIRYACTSNKGEGNNRELYINGVATGSMTYNGEVTYSQVVPGGEVTIKALYDKESVLTEDIMNYKYIKFDVTPDVSDADYTRDVTEGRYGTICVPNGGIIVGADIFELAYYGATSKKFFFDEIASAEMEAGKPYLFFPHEGATQLGVYYTDSENKSGLTVNGFVGFIGADADAYTQVPANDNCYIISNNLYRQVQTGAVAYILSNRAYIDMTSVTNIEPAKAPGARRIGLGVQGKDQAQGFENIETGDAPMKVMINGTMYILRGEKVYDATGRLVK